MNLQNTDLLLFDDNILTVFALDFFLVTCTLFLLLWVLILQNRKDLGFLSLSTNSRSTVFLIILLFLFISYFSNLVSFTLIPANGSLTLDGFGYNANVITTFVCFLYFCLSWSSLKNRGSANELCCLILISLISLLVLTRINDFLSLFMCLELQALAFYVLACFRKNSDFSVEASVKYFITGAVSTSFMLFGVSLLYGITGTLNFVEIKHILFCLSSFSSSLDSSIVYLTLNLGFLFLLISFFFKLGISPLHFWLPDVYEGSPTNVTAFFALVPKTALLVITARLLFDVFEPLSWLWQPILFQVALLSIIIGTVGAMHQRRIKRLLAYSTISHNGFLALALASGNQEGLNSLIIYLFVYLLTSSSIFLFLLSINERGFFTENPTFYESCGIIKTHKFLGVCLALPLFSLAGIPPLFGFIAKYQIFFSTLQAGYLLISLVLVLVSVISCYYYIRIVKVYFFENTVISWNSNLSRDVSLCFSLFCGLMVLFSIFPRFSFTLIF
jgi:NADH-quinone oxidoreductase subunit N